MWALELEGEVASDLSAFHRVDDMWSMGSRRWAQLVPRLYAYSGAVQMRVKAMAAEERQLEQEQPQVGGGVGVQTAVAADGTPLLSGPPSPLQGGIEVESTQTALRFSDIGDMFSFSTVAAPST